jgi:plastocyanin
MRVISVLSVLLLCVFTAASCSNSGYSNSTGPSGTPIASGPNIVLIPNGTALSNQGPGYAPTPATVATGTTVTWGNNDGYQHTSVSDNGAWNLTMDPGKTGIFQFTAPGTYNYHCSIHPFMKGTIVVQ